MQRLALALAPLLLSRRAILARAETFGPLTVEVGGPNEDSNNGPFSGGVFWSESVCYRPVTSLRPGDTLKFTYAGHGVYCMASEQHAEDCDFADAGTGFSVRVHDHGAARPTDERGGRRALRLLDWCTLH